MKLLRVLQIDRPEPADRALARLRGGGFDPIMERVETAGAFVAALAAAGWDVVLAGYPSGDLGVPSALALIRERGLDLPLVVVGAPVSGDHLSSLLAEGVQDHVASDDLGRLVPAVERALREAEARRAVRETERALRLNQAITAAASAALTIPDALTVVLDHFCRHTGWPVGHLFLAEGGELVSTAVWQVRDPSRFAAFLSATEGLRFPADQGFPGRVLTTGAPLWVEDVAADPTFARGAAARAAGLVSAVAFPVRSGDEVAAILEFFIDAPTPRDAPLLGLLEQVGVQLGPVVQRIQAVEALRRSESRYRLLFQGSPHPMWFHDEETLAILAVNDAAVKTYRYTREEFLRMTVRDLWAFGDAAASVPEGVGRTQRNLQWKHRTKDGTVIEVEVSSQAIPFGGRRARVVLAQDVSGRKRAERALRESERRYARAVAGANDGLWDWDLVTGEVYYSPRWKSLLGYKDAEIGTSIEEWLGRVHPEDVERLRGKIAAHLREAHGHLEDEHRVRQGNGSYLWMLGRGRAVWAADGRPSRMAGSLSDISDRKRATDQLLYDAYHDALTGLPNRSLFLDRLEHAANRSRRHGATFGVLFLDLDRFKVVNDSLGHGIGDQLLVAVAAKLQACLRAGDTVARLGGDEFTMLLEDVPDAALAMRTAERILRDLARPMDLSGHQVAVTASIGITLGRGGTEHSSDLLRDADIAMYRAKALGKGRYEMFDPTMHERMIALLRLEEDLRAAVERSELRLHYQPIVSIATGRIQGFEALLRWEHPRRGNVLPDEFVPVAEETGLIVPLGAWALREACLQVRAWQDRFVQDPPLSMSVNISARQMMQGDLASEVSGVLHDVGLGPSSLKLEITETRLEIGEAAAVALQRLKDLGVQLVVDDFGTGYSALSRLTLLPIDALKIDRSFVSAMMTDAHSQEIVRMIVGLAHVLGITAVAEGVETVEQLDVLRKLGCEYGQGYLFCRPVPAEAAESYLAERGSGPGARARPVG